MTRITIAALVLLTTSCVLAGYDAACNTVFSTPNCASHAELRDDAVQPVIHRHVESSQQTLFSPSRTVQSSFNTPFERSSRNFMRFGRDVSGKLEHDHRDNDATRSDNIDAEDVRKRFMRFGKRFMRFGRNAAVPDMSSVGDVDEKRFMRFGRLSGDAESSVDAEKRPARHWNDLWKAKQNSKRFMRFGKRFMRFGRAKHEIQNPTASDDTLNPASASETELRNKRFMRFGKANGGVQLNKHARLTAALRDFDDFKKLRDEGMGADGPLSLDGIEIPTVHDIVRQDSNEYMIRFG